MIGDVIEGVLTRMYMPFHIGNIQKTLEAMTRITSMIKTSMECYLRDIKGKSRINQREDPASEGETTPNSIENKKENLSFSLRLPTS